MVDISNLIHIIRSGVFGSDIREAIARALEILAENLTSGGGSQDQPDNPVNPDNPDATNDNSIVENALKLKSASVAAINGSVLTISNGGSNG